MKILMILLSVSLFFLFCVPAWADQIVTTQDGRKVLLKDDGTWEYLNKRETSPFSVAKEKEPWHKNIVAEFHGYHWFTDGNVTHRHLWDILNIWFGFSHLKYDTDSNLYIIGGELGYKLNHPFLKRITVGYETSQGSSDVMHGTDTDPLFNDSFRTDFDSYLGFQKHSGTDSTKYINAILYFRPLEGSITEHIDGYLDLLVEWIRYKDRVTITEVNDITPGEDVDIFAGAPNPFKIRHEGAGVGFRGGLRLFDMFKLEGLLTYYPEMSVKRTLLWDVPINRKFVFFGEDETGFKGRVSMGFTPPMPIKALKNRLELEVGYQYMQFQQHGGRGRVHRFRPSQAAEIDKWERAKTWRDGIFVGGTIRW